jgi:hypothetical protein
MQLFVHTLVDEARMPTESENGTDVVLVHGWPTEDGKALSPEMASLYGYKDKQAIGIALPRTTEFCNLEEGRCRALTVRGYNDVDLVAELVQKYGSTANTKYIREKFDELVATPERKLLVAVGVESEGAIITATQHTHGDKKKRLVMNRVQPARLPLDPEANPDEIWGAFMRDMMAANVMGQESGTGDDVPHPKRPLTFSTILEKILS